MTRATLLQLLAHPTALTGADVRALEQLAEAFPYCQSAHLLLAKAAHDQGSMLAGQRLRRAATYAADRSLLRQLIELPEAATLLAAPMVGQADNLASVNLPSTPFVAAPPLAEEPSEPPLPTPGPVITLPEDQPGQIIGQPEVAVLNPNSEEPAGASTPAAPAPLHEPAAGQLPVLYAEQVPAPVEDELPPQAPPIRPPAEAVAAQLEFGLVPVEPAEIIAYQLPELIEPLGASPEEEQPVITPRLPAFSGLAGVSYAPSEGSRLGFCLMGAGAAEALPTSSLPPADEFFAPDAALLAHLAAHQPAAPKASSLDLINSFLKRAPAPARRRSAPVPGVPEPDDQTDLSVRSTRAEPDLASESLAKILARQGKTERAIAVYERLMVKQPEKMAYFAAQIESLRPSA